jgi:hypothetical protein
MDLARTRWRKSTRSAEETSCVEVATVDSAVAR